MAFDPPLPHREDMRILALLLLLSAGGTLWWHDRRARPDRRTGHALVVVLACSTLLTEAGYERGSLR